MLKILKKSLEKSKLKKMTKVSETVLEINLSALKDNYNYLRSKLNKSTKFMAVVKSYAYGSDAVEIAKELVGFGDLIKLQGKLSRFTYV